MKSSAKARGSYITKRTPKYIEQKMMEGKVVVAIRKDEICVGFRTVQNNKKGNGNKYEIIKGH